MPGIVELKSFGVPQPKLQERYRRKEANKCRTSRLKLIGELVPHSKRQLWELDQQINETLGKRSGEVENWL